jgi:glycosyltransferase involved in cell wall biosynthesis
VVGFFGLIEAWIDLHLLVFLAKRRPDWTLLLIGRVAVDLGELAHLRNVVLVGPQPYEDLPAWARVFDVAILPYRRNRQVLNSNPLKLREYLAAGRPVVSVSALEIERFADCIRIADEPEEFLQCVDAALQDSEERRRRGLEVVSDMTWESRVDEVWDVIQGRLRSRQE